MPDTPERRGLDPVLIKQIEHQYGFDKPLHERLWLMLKSYARLDFGNSFFRGATVTDLILQKCRSPYHWASGRRC